MSVLISLPTQFLRISALDLMDSPYSNPNKQARRISELSRALIRQRLRVLFEAPGEAAQVAGNLLTPRAS